MIAARDGHVSEVVVADRATPLDRLHAGAARAHATGRRLHRRRRRSSPRLGRAACSSTSPTRSVGAVGGRDVHPGAAATRRHGRRSHRRRRSPRRWPQRRRRRRPRRRPPPWREHGLPPQPARAFPAGLRGPGAQGYNELAPCLGRARRRSARRLRPCAAGRPRPGTRATSTATATGTTPPPRSGSDDAFNQTLHRCCRCDRGAALQPHGLRHPRRRSQHRRPAAVRVGRAHAGDRRLGRRGAAAPPRPPGRLAREPPPPAPHRVAGRPVPRPSPAHEDPRRRPRGLARPEPGAVRRAPAARCRCAGRGPRPLAARARGDAEASGGAPRAGGPRAPHSHRVARLDPAPHPPHPAGPVAPPAAARRRARRRGALLDPGGAVGARRPGAAGARGRERLGEPRPTPSRAGSLASPHHPATHHRRLRPHPRRGPPGSPVGRSRPDPPRTPGRRGPGQPDERPLPIDPSRSGSPGASSRRRASTT